MSTLDILQERTIGNVSFMSLAGSLDAHTHTQLKQAILEQTSQDVRRFILEMSRLEFISSAGINILTSADKTVKEMGGGLVLMRVNPKIRQIFDVLCLTPVFTIAETREGALQKLGIKA